jgi:transposase-like protein
VEGIGIATQGSRYNDEFKVDIIRLNREENQSINRVAKDLGVNDQTICN